MNTMRVSETDVTLAPLRLDFGTLSTVFPVAISQITRSCSKVRNAKCRQSGDAARGVHPGSGFHFHEADLPVATSNGSCSRPRTTLLSAVKQKSEWGKLKLPSDFQACLPVTRSQQ